MTSNNDKFSTLNFSVNNQPSLPETSKISELPGFNNRFKIKKTRTYNRNRTLPLLMPAGIALYHWSKSSDKLKIANIRSKIIETAKSPVLNDVISEIAPFLDLGVQHNLYTIIGIIEILSTTRSLADGSFQKQHIQIPLVREPKNSLRSFVKAIKRLKSDVNGQVLDNAVLSYEISDKLFDIMRKEESGSNTSAKITKRLDELLFILKPLLPQKYSSNISKFTKLIKIAQALNAADDILMSSATNPTENPSTDNTDNKPKTESSDPHSNDFGLKRENLDGSRSVTENPNEGSAGSLDIISNLITLLS